MKYVNILFHERNNMRRERKSFMDLNQVAAFIQVAQAGSYSEASRRQGIPKSTLSRQVSELERRLGVILIQRSTRQFQLTPAGRNYFTQCHRLLSGLVRFTAPAEAGSYLLAPLFLEFSKMYPRIDLDLVFTDRVVSMIEEKFDVALRTWDAADPSLKSRKVGPEKFILVSSPQYFKKVSPPKHPKDLHEHTVITFSSRKNPSTWRLTNGEERVQIHLESKYFVNTLSVCKTLAQEGMGLSFLPYFYAQEDIKARRLLHILPSWSTEITHFALVYPDQKFTPTKNRVLIEFLSEKLKERLIHY
jgi:DNA-binding transcriptional LysR family regulator